MIYCDVCDAILVVSGTSDIEEEYKIICPECGYDNTYQIGNFRELDDALSIFMDGDDIYDDEIMLAALAERFGTDIEDLRDMIDEREMLGWDMRIKFR